MNFDKTSDALFLLKEFANTHGLEIIREKAKYSRNKLEQNMPVVVEKLREIIFHLKTEIFNNCRVRSLLLGD